MGELIGSLFSGAGGLDLAVQAVFGGEVVWHAEIDKAASRVLEHRFPGVPNLGSVTDIDWAAVPAVDVLCGGFPCQDVSAAGKRAGIKAGTRSGLWSVFADAIDALRPQWVVIENVRGLLSATAHRTVEDDAGRDVEPAAGVMGDGAGRPVLRAAGAVLGDLADLGYDAQWATVAAADIGAPHRRERVFILAADTECQRYQRQSKHTCRRESDTAWSRGRCQSEGQGSPSCCGQMEVWVGGVALLPTPTSSQGRNETSGRKPGSKHNTGTTLNDVVFKGEIGTLLPTPAAKDGSGGCIEGTMGGKRPSGAHRTIPLATAVHHMLLPTPNASDGSGGGQHPDKREGHSRQLIDYVLLCTPSASDGAGGKTSRSGGRIDEPLLGGQAREMATAWGKYEPAIRRWEALVSPAPAPTEPNKNGNPRLSAAFSEWLMGWPAGWVTDPAIGISRNDQLRIIGNGVCPQQATAALQLLLPVSEVTP